MPEDWKKPKRREAWDARTKLIAKHIPEYSLVLEFGAWARYLEQILPYGCEYIPSDITSRGLNTIVCDLNKTLPEFPTVDIIVFGGVLEYVADVPRLISHLKDSCTTIIATYVFTPQWRFGKQKNTFLEIFEKNGFRLVKDVEYKGKDHRLMVFTREMK